VLALAIDFVFSFIQFQNSTVFDFVSAQNFGRGEINSFLMKCPEEIGTPLSLQICHDDTPSTTTTTTTTDMA